MIPDNIVTLQSKYLTSVTKVDEQHQQMAYLLEALCQSVIESHIENRLDHKINELFAELVNLTRDHFNTEQQLMQRHHYAESQKHCEEHAMLLKKVISIRESCESGDMVLSYRFIRRLTDEWFLKHILEMDIELGLYLRNKGVA